MANFINWLFIDPVSEGGGPNGDPTPFNATWWVVIMVALLLVSFYYVVEGRKRIPWIKDHTIRKYVLDRMMPQAAWLGGVGVLLIVSRIILNYALFAWRIWLFAWIIWAAVLVGYWIHFFIVRYQSMNVAYISKLERDKFIPSANKNKRKTATARR